MANLCMNKLELSSRNKGTLETLQKAFFNHSLLDALVEMPKELKQSSHAIGANLEMIPDWYRWAINNWGCRSDVGPDESDRLSERYPIVGKDDTFTLTLRFDSPWSPPRDAVYALAHTDVQFTLSYYEPNVGFCGFITEGDMQEWDTSADDGEDPIPDSLREEFGIGNQ